MAHVGNSWVKSTRDGNSIHLMPQLDDQNTKKLNEKKNCSANNIDIFPNSIFLQHIHMTPTIKNNTQPSGKSLLVVDMAMVTAGSGCRWMYFCCGVY